MRIRTQNSMYEIDEVNHTVKRLEGVNSPTPYIEAARPYQEAFVTPAGLYIVWGYNPDKGALETTLTSEITEVIPD